MHVRFRLRTKFQLKFTVLNFSTKLVKKGSFQSKTEKVNITIEFYILKLVCVPNLSLNWQLWISDFLVENGKTALVRASMIVTYYVNLFRTGTYRHNSILMSLLLLVTETISGSKETWNKNLKLAIVSSSTCLVKGIC